MTDEHKRNGVHVSVSTGISLASVVLVAVAWGTSWERVQKHDQEIESLQARTAAQSEQLSEIRAQYAEIVRRLEYIDRRLDRIQRADDR